MKKQWLLILFVLFCSATTFGKTKTAIKQNVPELSKLLSGCSLQYKMINDTLAAIPYEGENIASYNVVIQKVSDLYIIYSNLTIALLGKIV